MERNIILDFIAQNFTFFSNINLQEMTICIYGKNYENPFYKNIFNGEEIYLYDVKLPRIYSKKIPLEKINDGLLEFIGTLNKPTCLDHDDFTFDLFEPYNNRNIKNMEFNYLYLFPIVKNEMHVASIIIYSDCKESFELTSASITSMINKLTLDDEETFSLKINESFNNTDSYYYFVKHKQFFYPSASLNSLFLKSKYEEKEIEEFLKHKYLMKKNMPFPFEDCELYYIEINKYKNVNIEFLNILSIKYQNLSNDFTLLYFEWNDKKDVTSFIFDLNINSIYYVYCLENNQYLILINDNINEKELRGKIKINEYFCILQAPKHINNKMDLIKLSAFITYYHPSTFILDDYLKYLNCLGADLLNSKRNSIHSYQLINSNSLKSINLINNYNKNIKYESTFNDYEEKVITKLEKNLKKDKQEIACYLNTKTLEKKKIYDIVKKYDKNNIVLTINLTASENLKKEAFYDYLGMLKKYAIKVYVDSSIFLSFKYAEALRIIDGCYINKEEFEELHTKFNSFTDMIIKYFYNENKDIVFEKNDLKFDVKHKDELIYFIQRKE